MRRRIFHKHVADDAGSRQWGIRIGPPKSTPLTPWGRFMRMLRRFLPLVLTLAMFLPLWVRVMTRVANWYRNSGIGGQTWA